MAVKIKPNMGLSTFPIVSLQQWLAVRQRQSMALSGWPVVTRSGIISMIFLKRENYARGVVVRQTDNGVKIEVNIIVSYGTKISEVCRNVQDKVKYNLETMLGVTTDEVTVIVQGVKVLGD
ncbi:alkaline-shock protein yloU / general stress protein [Lacticaseibacillus rhamnosus MTCC 5462]|nr:alkaline-shock protein yloU / general stress protein [Lacticaseibacillus rhamnosus MTCC 5462]